MINMRIILYLVSLIGFMVLAVQLTAALLGLATYIAILLIVCFLMAMAFIFRASLVVATAATDIICAVADLTSYFDIEKERKSVQEQLNNPYYYAQKENEFNTKTNIANKELDTLRRIYPFADNILFGKYAGCIAGRQFNQLKEVKMQIERSHIHNLNNFNSEMM